MPVLILLDTTKTNLTSITNYFNQKYKIEIHKENFNTTKQKLSNMSKTTLYILLNCDIKPQRYEIYCLSKKQDTPYCVLSNTELSKNKHDTGIVIKNIEQDIKLIEDMLMVPLVSTSAHKKKFIFDNNYIMNVKNLIKKVNLEFSDKLEFVLRECESKIFRMIYLNPVCVDEIEDVYRRMVEEM